jgi:hypothetical protein
MGVPKGVRPLRGVRDARNNERHVCGRRRDGEPAGSSREGAGPLSGSRGGRRQGRLGDGAWFKSRRPLQLRLVKPAEDMKREA